MKTINSRTLFAGKAWLGDKHLDILEKGDLIQVRYQGEIMTISPDQIPELRKNKSTRSFRDRKTRKPYWLWGIKWKPDVDNQASLFSN